MTNQQMQYAYWQRMMQQQLYRAYAAGVQKKQSEKVILTLHIQYDGETWGTTVGHIEDSNGNVLPVDTPIEIIKGSDIILKARPVAEAVEQFVKWTDDETLPADRIVLMDSDKEITAVFHQNVS